MKTAHDTGTQVLLYEPTYALSDRRVAGQSFHRNPPRNFSAAVLDALAVCADEVSASVRDLASQFGDRRLPRRTCKLCHYSHRKWPPQSCRDPLQGTCYPGVPVPLQWRSRFAHVRRRERRRQRRRTLKRRNRKIRIVKLLLVAICQKSWVPRFN